MKNLLRILAVVMFLVPIAVLFRIGPCPSNDLCALAGGFYLAPLIVIFWPYPLFLFFRTMARKPRLRLWVLIAVLTIIALLALYTFFVFLRQPVPFNPYAL